VGRTIDTCRTHGDDERTLFASACVHSGNGVFSQKGCDACTVASAATARTAGVANLGLRALHSRMIEVTVALLPATSLRTPWATIPSCIRRRQKPKGRLDGCNHHAPHPRSAPIITVLRFPAPQAIVPAEFPTTCSGLLFGTEPLPSGPGKVSSVSGSPDRTYGLGTPRLHEGFTHEEWRHQDGCDAAAERPEATQGVPPTDAISVPKPSRTGNRCLQPPTGTLRSGEEQEAVQSDGGSDADHQRSGGCRVFVAPL
jgi:hypothetical protein